MAMIIANSPKVTIVRPNCSRCGTRMSLARIFPDKPGFDQRTFECACCEHEVTEIVRLQEGQ
jgi:transposase